MMKTVKYILLILLLNCSMLLMATTYQLHQTSNATFKSVSSAGMGSANVGQGSMRNGGVSTSGAIATVAAPAGEFHSTSTMSTSGSSLPNAAAEGVVIVNDTDNGADKPSGPRRVGGFGDNNYGDPGAQPIGDIPWLMMALLVLGYAIYLRRKNSVRTSNSGHQQ